MQQAEEDGVVEAADVSAAAALDSSYFSQYDEPAAHEAWLKDGPLISAWKEAIQKHGEQIRGKVVVDVGSGLGALAVLCAQVRPARAVLPLTCRYIAEVHWCSHCYRFQGFKLKNAHYAAPVIS